jgi:predicted nucleotidyltransferase
MSIRAYQRTFQQRLDATLKAREKVRNRVLQRVLAKIPQLIARYSTIQRAYLFGSVTRRGLFHAQSDIDIGIEGANTEDYFALWNTLEEALPDLLIDLRDIPPDSYFGHQIYKTGILLYERTN